MSQKMTEKTEPPGRIVCLQLGIVFLALFLLRFPRLFSPNHILDGDEAILGLMAWQAALGRDIPVFFWGQSYGFSLLETLPAALAFRLFCSSLECIRSASSLAGNYIKSGSILIVKRAGSREKYVLTLLAQNS